MARVKHWLIISIAILLFLLGLASVWTPFPIGAILMGFATFLLIANSRSGRRFVTTVRRRFGWVDGRMVWFEDRVDNRVGRVLRTTRPLASRQRIRAALGEAAE